MSSSETLAAVGKLTDLPAAAAAGAAALDQVPALEAAAAGLQTSLDAATSLIAAQRPTSYTVQAGDTLAKIAKKLGVADWRSLQAWNQLTSTTIRPGQQLAAIVTTPAPAPPPVPPPAAGTVFGMNLGSRSVATRLGQFGRVPMVKLFDLVDVTKLVPEARAQVCKPWDQAALAAGTYDAQIVAYLQAQLAAGVKKLVLTNRQEPEDLLKVSQANVDQWKAATKHLAALVKADGVKGVTAVAPCLIAPHKQTDMVVPDSWMLSPDDLGGQEWCIWSWDDYGNPAGAKNYGNDPYATPYPTGEEIAVQQWAPLQKFGWTRWGISEFNSPWRKDLKPADVDHSGRLKYLDDYVKACMAAPVGPPEWMFLWEEVGNKYDQTFTLPAEYAWWKGWVAQSA